MTGGQVPREWGGPPSRLPWLVPFHGRGCTVEYAEAVRESNRRERAEQGLPEGVTDPATVDKVLVLLGLPPKYRRVATAKITGGG